MSEYEQFLALVPDEGCGSPAGRFLLRVVTEASIKGFILDDELVAIAHEVTR